MQQPTLTKPDDEGISCLLLTKGQLISLWDQGFLNDLGFFTLLLKFQYQNEWHHRLGNGGQISICLSDEDIDYLIEEWRGRSLDRKPKFLNRGKILDLMGKMAKANQSTLLFEELTLLCAQEILGIDPEPPQTAQAKPSTWATWVPDQPTRTATT